MKKITWIFVIVIVIITGVYFMVTKAKGNILNDSGYNNTEEIPQPPQLPE